MNAHDLHGRAVVTLSDAEKVGTIDDVLFDAHYRQVLGFRVKKGVFGRAEAVLRDSVASVGTDALTVQGPHVINNEDRFAELNGALSLDQAHGTKVVSEGGTLIGLIDAIEIDDQAQSVLGYVLNASLVDRMRHRERHIPASAVLRFGESGIMIVPEDAGEAPQVGPS